MFSKSNELHTDRFKSLDFLRGIVMILMVLDHARWFMHITAQSDSPENLKTTTVALYFTRWVTHFCAPVFIFLVGTSAWFINLKKGVKEASHFLWTRGLFLILLELTVFRLAWDGTLTNPTISLLVIWTIGISMVFLALIIRFLKFKWILILGLLIVFGHNLFDSIKPNSHSLSGKIWIVLHATGGFRLTDKLGMFFLFPALPYFGLVCLGYCFGKLYTQPSADTRKKYLLLLGLGSVILFALLRYFNLYGDPKPWTLQGSPLFSFLSFLKTTKYPTSLMYNLMTIGPALILLYFTDRKIPKLLSPIIEIGQVPMFFYLFHLYIIKLATIIGPGYSKFTLTQLYIAWFICCSVLYIICHYYRIYKFRHPEKTILKYL